MVRIYVRNDATDAANLAAKNVRVRSYFNSDASDKGIITGAVVASNILMSDNSNKIGTRGNRGFFWDTVDIRSGDGTKFSLTMKDKPRYYNVAHADGVDISSDGKTLGFMPDNAGSYAGANVSDTGAAVGYDKMDGNLPSGKQYAGYAVYTLTAKKADQHIGMTLSAKTADQSKYATDSITAKPGDKVNFKIDYKNNASKDMVGITFKATAAESDVTPLAATTLVGTTTAYDESAESSWLNAENKGVREEDKANVAVNRHSAKDKINSAYNLAYVDGSGKVTNATHNDGVAVKDGDWTDHGLQIGNVKAGDGGTIEYTLQVPAANKMFCGRSEFETIAIAKNSEMLTQLSRIVINVDNNSDGCAAGGRTQVTGSTSAANSSQRNGNTPGAPAAGVQLGAAIGSSIALCACAAALCVVLRKKSSK